MTWYWYVARGNELLVDCDGRTLLEIALKRINNAREGIETRNVFVAPSATPEHFHMAVRLASTIPDLRRIAYQLYLMDHVYRSYKSLIRYMDGVANPSLLISPAPWPVDATKSEKKFTRCFWRKHDAFCQCEAETHKNPDLIATCPAHQILRGKHV